MNHLEAIAEMERRFAHRRTFLGKAWRKLWCRIRGHKWRWWGNNRDGDTDLCDRCWSFRRRLFQREHAEERS